MTTIPQKPAEAEKPEAKPSIDPAFVETVKAFLKGDKEPKDPQSKAVLNSLKAAVADQEALVGQMGKVEQLLREGQAKGQQLLGRIEALVSVLQDFEADGAAKP